MDGWHILLSAEISSHEQTTKAMINSSSSIQPTATTEINKALGLDTFRCLDARLSHPLNGDPTVALISAVGWMINRAFRCLVTNGGGSGCPRVYWYSDQRPSDPHLPFTHQYPNGREDAELRRQHKSREDVGGEKKANNKNILVWSETERYFAFSDLINKQMQYLNNDHMVGKEWFNYKYTK